MAMVWEQAHRNGFEYGGAGKTPITFYPFDVHTSKLQFWKWQTKSQNMVEPWLHGFICSGGPGELHTFVLLLKFKFLPVSVQKLVN